LASHLRSEHNSDKEFMVMHFYSELSDDPT